MNPSDIPNAVIELAKQNPDWIILIVFLLSVVEFVPFVWFAIVGVAAIAGAGDAKQLWLVVLAATLGGAAGDTLLYWLGRRYQARVAKLWPFSKRPQLLARSNAFFKKWGEGAVVLGRFLGPVRIGAPVVAGTMQMSWPRFLAATLLAAFVWAVVFLWPSAFGGQWLSRVIG
jgi:membrane protein DedA with SNARE-associated domain